ncbi:pectinesterase family protein [Anaerosporobacter faecicola]|uniref:pectinesterase family protein n=1 Tax=Anaerosporobacter faecicola TaxID=2718714 RepID=UPI001A9C1F90|nr:pectinesterase family protein [Anaerosporobacter faecicola]
MEKEYIVAKDGSGDFTKVQAAIDAVACGNDQPVTIRIKKGVYKEVVTIPAEKSFIKLVGEDREETVITYDNYAGMLDANGEKIGTFRSPSVFIDGSNVTASNLTFENTFFQPGFDAMGRQAVALSTTGEGNTFINCSFKGYQDTLYAQSGSCYFLNCYLEGDVDYIFGAAHAVFENCQLHSLDRGSKTENGYVTAASTKASDAYGFLFINCTLTADETMAPNSVYLGRPWHPSMRMEPVCAATVFMHCELGAHIREDGWTNMHDAYPETERLYEYENTGAGCQINEKRRQLTAKEVQHCTKQGVLGW